MIVTLSEFCSVVFYILIIAASTVLMSQAKKRNSVVLLVIAIILISLILGLRYHVGRDFNAYNNAYNLIASKSNITEAKKYYAVETSYFVICFISKALFNSSLGVFLFYAIFTTIFYMCGLWYFKDEIHIEWAMLYYLTMLFWGCMNTMRQHLAIAIVFWGFRFCVERKPLKYFAVVIVSTLFHQSAIVSILIYFCTGEKNKFKKVITAIVAFICAFFADFLIYGFNKYGGSRAGNYQATSHFGVGFIVVAVELGLFLYCGNRCELKGEKYSFVRDLFILSAALCVLDYTLGDASRIRNYFNTIEMVAMASYPTIVFHRTAETKKYPLMTITIYDAFLVAYYFVYLVMGFINRDSSVFPYAFRLF